VYILIDVAISGDRNLIKAKVLPLITGATGTVSKSLRQYLSNISGKDEIKEI
jgi:hypothetical protein